MSTGAWLAYQGALIGIGNAEEDIVKLSYGLRPEPPRGDEFARALWTVSTESFKLQEKWLLLHVQPAPWWCPVWLWRRLVARVLRMESRP